jgi:hypothetical protein
MKRQTAQVYGFTFCIWLTEHLFLTLKLQNPLKLFCLIALVGLGFEKLPEGFPYAFMDW